MKRILEYNLEIAINFKLYSGQKDINEKKNYIVSRYNTHSTQFFFPEPKIDFEESKKAHDDKKVLITVVFITYSIYNLNYIELNRFRELFDSIITVERDILRIFSEYEVSINVFESSQ